ncbi:choice-of-anchor D domain-containing protein [Actinophytocola sp.]|uniref:choice-of-anchor D domain-containing protein n=1 Tax=Actinophytocola sp. TaxID=1872138 RepID=UPI00389A3236
MPKSLLSSKRAIAVAVAATLAGVSAAVVLAGQTTTAHAAAAPGSTVRASVANGSNAESPRGGANSELSADGTAVVFTSYSQLDDIKTGDNQNVYVRDLRDGRTVLISRGQFTRPVPPPTTTTTTTTTTTPPCCIVKLGGDPMLSLNGRRAQPSLEYGETAATGDSSQPTVSADGRYVAFVTDADNIVPEDADTDQDIIICDRDPDGDGTFDEPREGGGLDLRYFRVNQPQVVQGDGGSYRVDFPSFPKLADDASRIVWEDTQAEPSGQYRDVVRTSVLRPPAGGVIGGTSLAASAAPGLVQNVDTPLGAAQPTAQYSPDVSADGRYVVLQADYVRTEGPVEFPDHIPFHAIIRKDMDTGTVLRVDWDVDTSAEHVTYLSEDESVHLASPAVSGNGGEVTFVAEAYQDHCSEGDCWYSVANQPIVYVVRIDDDGNPVDSIIASRDNDNEVVNGIRPALSGDGRFVAFGTDNLHTHDGVDVTEEVGSDCVVDHSDLRSAPMVDLSGLPPTSDAANRRTVCQVVVRDLVVDRERVRQEVPRLPGTLVSAGTGTDCAETVPTDGTCAGNGDSPPFRGTGPTLSHNGSTVGFDSRATNLLADQEDRNRNTDVFVRTFQPALRADPSPLSFGKVTLGDTFDKVVRFFHVGTGPLVVNEIAVEGSDEFSVGAQTCGGEAVVLQQTGSCEVSVTFAPKKAEDRTGTLRLTLRDGRRFTVPLQGTGAKQEVPPEDARFAAGPDPLNFGDRLLLSDGPTQTVTVTNVGGSPLTIKTVEVVSAAAPGDYTIAADTCTGKPVAPKGTCQVTVKLSPSGPGDRPAVLRFVDGGPGGNAHLIGLAGKGSTPAVLLSPGVTQPGFVVTVGGTGFAPDNPVTITMADSIETTHAVPDAAGNFSAGLLVLPKSPVGNRLVTATIDGTTVEAQRPLLIVTPTVTASDFVVRG